MTSAVPYTLDLFDNIADQVDPEFGSYSFKFIDLFAGIGGFHLALSSLGGSCVFASEMDKYARETYIANHVIDPLQFNDDIRKIAPDAIPDHDVLCAGFPCQPFSQAGQKQGFNDGRDSERGNLFFCIVDILEAKRPKAFILENVRHLVNHDEGKTFAIIMKLLRDIGYYVEYKVLKASDFNVPQHRARVFIVGFDQQNLIKNDPFQFPPALPLTQTMADIFNAPCDKKIGFTLRVGGKGSKIDDRRNWEFYRVDGEVKRLGLPEAKKMMTFPEHFVFPVSTSQAMKQLGNSVCVDVVKAVAKNTIGFIQQSMQNNLQNRPSTEINELVIKRNKGELSEIYALLKVIQQKIIPYGDAKAQPTAHQIQVIKLHQKHQSIALQDLSIDIITGDKTTSINTANLITQAELNALVTEIKAGCGTFNSPKLDSAMKLLNAEQTKGNSFEKADVTMDFAESGHLFQQQGIGIKSFLGNSPTLLNASQATNFIYKIENLDPTLVDTINQIDSSAKIKDRLSEIKKAGATIRFYACENPVYESTLRKTDSKMPEILSEALLSFFLKETSKFLSSYPRTKITHSNEASEIDCRLRDFVKATMLGIFPTREWDGELSAQGVFLLKNDGEIVFYHTNQDSVLKKYFYEHCFFDTPSSTRHRFGLLYKENNQIFFKLNLQLRLTE